MLSVAHLWQFSGLSSPPAPGMGNRTGKLGLDPLLRATHPLRVAHSVPWKELEGFFFVQAMQKLPALPHICSCHWARVD